LNHHALIVVGLCSLSWSGHLYRVVLPVSRGELVSDNNETAKIFTSADWSSYMDHVDAYYQLYGSTLGSGISSLTFLGGIRLDTMSLYITDVIHHHISIGVLLLLSVHLYISLYVGLGYRFNYISSSSRDVSIIWISQHVQLSYVLGGLGMLTSLVSQHRYTLSAYSYQCYDSASLMVVYVHHQFITAFFMVASLLHVGMWCIRDYVTRSEVSLLLYRYQLMSHLSWISLYLGFHTLIVWIHNDSIIALGDSDKILLIEPLFSVMLQEACTH